MDESILIDLLIKAQSGDKIALEKLCKYSEEFIRNYFTYKFKDVNVVDDLCQETYSRLINSFVNIREPVKYKNFVLKTAFFVVQDFLRKKVKIHSKMDSLYDLEDYKFSVYDVNASFDEHVISEIDLKNALKKLPPKSQLILKMQSEGYRYHEIANKLGLSESAIKMQVKRSLKKLSELLFIVTFIFQLATKIF